MFDVAIIGHSLVGKTLARLLANTFPQLSIAIIDQRPLLEAPKDSRASALSPSSQYILENMGAWADIAPGAAPMRTIQLGTNPLELSPFSFHSEAEPLGWNVANEAIHAALSKAPAKGARYILGHGVSQIQLEPTHVSIYLENNTSVSCRLLIGADGHQSTTRQRLSRTQTVNYNQTAISVTAQHSQPHHNVAYEYFLPQGVMAFIPLQGPHQSTCVLALKNHLFTDDALEIERLTTSLMRDHLGEITLPAHLPTYPLAAKFAKPRYGHRWVLVGDAANTIHPAAGQGLNLALRDVSALINHLKKQLELGMDIGSEIHLREYAKSRKKDQSALFGVTHASAKYFTSISTPLRKATHAGLKGLTHTPGLSTMLASSAKHGL